MSRAERLTLYVALTALTAFSIDGLLPAMLMIGDTLGISPPLSVSQIVTVFVLGMAMGEFAIGPVSDATGRRVAVFAGLIVFALGTIVALMAETYAMVLFGRFLQGVGVAGPKIGTRAMIRDRHEGADMARTMSAIFTLLLLVPMIAPAIGAAIAAMTGWRGIFAAYLAMAVGLGLWLWFRHPETLPVERRVPLRPRLFAQNLRAILVNVRVTPVVIATGFVFGAQLSYFAVAAELFGVVYDMPRTMPLLFALLATGTASALLLNMRMVGRTGMDTLILTGLLFLGLSGTGLLISAALGSGQPPFAIFFGLTWLGFFGLGLLFGNLNALAMRPLGELAGLGSSVVASLSSLVAFVFASVLERLAQGPVWILAFSFAIAALLSAILIAASGRERLRRIVSREGKVQR